MSRYLDRLSFDPRLATGFIASYLTNVRVIALVVLVITAFGINGYLSLSRRVNPEVEIPIVFISTVLPGANPESVEQLVTIPLEESIESLSGVNTYSSTSQDNVSLISVEFDSSIDINKAKSDVQSAVDTVSDLPSDAQDPRVVALDFEDVPVWTFALTIGQQKDADDIASLIKFSDIMKERLESHPMVREVIVSGAETQEIQVLLKPEAIQQYRISPVSISQALQSSSNSYPAGEISSSTTSFSVAIDPIVNSVDDIRNLEVNISSPDSKADTVRLGEIADVVERSSPKQSKSYISSPVVTEQRIVTFSVFKLQSADIDETSDAVTALVSDVLKENGQRYEVVSILNSGDSIREQFDDLFQNLVVTIILVFFTLFIFLGIKQATIASITVPLAFLISFGVMQTLGLSLNFLTMFSLLLALGLVLDDTIVIISAMTSYYRSGKFTDVQAGLLVWRDFIVPIWSTTITTIWAFVPLLLSSGIIGEFIKSIPIVVSTALISSTATAVFITLPLMMVVVNPHIPNRVKALVKIFAALVIFAIVWNLFSGNTLRPVIILMLGALLFFVYKARAELRKEIYRYDMFKTLLSILKAHEQSIDNLRQSLATGIVNPRTLSNAYGALISKVLSSKRLRVKVIYIVVIFFVFSLMLVPLGFVKNEFFPKTDEDIISIQVELPKGTNIDITDAEARNVLGNVRSIPDAEHVIANVGQRAQSDSMSGATSGSNIFSITIKLKENREKSSIEIADELRNTFANYSAGEFKVVEASGGPPVGSDIEVSIAGNELHELDTLANTIMTYLQTQSGVVNVEKSIVPGTSKLSFEPSQAKLDNAGITIDQLGLWLRTYASGFTLDEARYSGKDRQDITFRMNSDMTSPESLSSLAIPTQTGPVPLLSLGKLTLKPNPTQISRENGNRIITVSASVEQGYNIPDINMKLGDFIDSEVTFPQGYSWSTGGVNRENQESVQSILQAMLLAFLLILGTMVVQLRSYRKALIVLLVIPLAISGVFIVFSITGVPLSFPALIGVLALFGIVVNNSIMLVDKINLNLTIGMPFKESIVDAASSRLEPIMFSSLTTLMGLLPITLTQPLWQGLGGAIIAGLTFSGTIMLLFIPVAYYIVFEKEHSTLTKKASSKIVN